MSIEKIIDDGWHARLAVWQEEWSIVEHFVQEDLLENRMKRLIVANTETGPASALIVLGVYTSLSLKKDDFEKAKAFWIEALKIIKSLCPNYMPMYRDYFDATLIVFAAQNAISVAPEEVGFPAGERY